MCNIYSVLGFLIALFIAVVGLMIGLDEPQNTPLELLSDLLKHGALALAGICTLPEVLRFLA